MKQYEAVIKVMNRPQIFCGLHPRKRRPMSASPSPPPPNGGVRRSGFLRMKDNGGYATLGHLYGCALKVHNCNWKTKTPFASIRRIVQDERFFFKIRPGLWALKEWKEKLPKELVPTEKLKKKDIEKYNHTYFQGLLVEIGNLKKLETYVPPQDEQPTFENVGIILGNSRRSIHPPFKTGVFCCFLRIKTENSSNENWATYPP